MEADNKILNEIISEARRAEDKYNHFNSTHEAYAVLAEEVNEFWNLVQSKTSIINKEGKRSRMIHELTQISAIAIRAINELKEDKIRWV